jgi:hypothetical protein
MRNVLLILLFVFVPYPAVAQNISDAYIPISGETESIAPAASQDRAETPATMLATLSVEALRSPLLSFSELSAIFPRLLVWGTQGLSLDSARTDPTISGTSTAALLLNSPFSWFNSVAASMGTDSSARSGSSDAEYPEIKEILAHQGDVTTQSAIYMQLLKRVGAQKAQDALNTSGLPFTGETHLIQHTAGTYIYETYGLPGITKCTLYFLGACYHEFFIHLLSDKGIGILPDVMKECWKIGPLSANQCAHGIGHGLVVWYGYDKLDKAAAGCEALKKQDPNFPDVFCYEGVFMENFWALHPSATVSERWISKSDPYYPCDDPRMKQAWEPGCWLNQGSLMYNLFFNHDIHKTSDACLAVQDTTYRELCFNSLARQIHPLTEGTLDKVVSMCGQVDASWTSYCMTTIASTDFANGGRELPFAICSYLQSGDKRMCYSYLLSTMQTYASHRDDFLSACSHISDDVYRQQCLDISATLAR